MDPWKRKDQLAQTVGNMLATLEDGAWLYCAVPDLDSPAVVAQVEARASLVVRGVSR